MEEKILKIDPFDSLNNQQRIALNREQTDRTSLFKIVNTVATKFEETFTNMREAFEFMDTNKDGVLSKDEFLNGIQKFKF